MLHIRGAVAEYERTLITERTRRGLQHRLQAGQLLPWSRTPYGYPVNPDHPRDPAGLHIAPGEAFVVAELFRRYSQEKIRLRALAKACSMPGIPSPTGNATWNSASIRAILSNPVYMGQVYAQRFHSGLAHGRRSPLQPIGRVNQGKIAVAPEAWLHVTEAPAIVTLDVFSQVQAKFDDNKRLAVRNKSQPTCLLYALVSCGFCQHCCRSVTRGNYTYYWCTGRRSAQQSGAAKECSSHNTNAAYLDDAVWNDLCVVLMQPDSIKEAVRRVQAGEWLPQELQQRQITTQKAAHALIQQIERVTEAYMAGIMGLEEYRRRRQEGEQRLQNVQRQQHELENQVAREHRFGDIAATIDAFCARLQQGLATASFEQKRQLIELLIDRVVVKRQEVEIRYVIPISPRGETTHFCPLRLNYFFRVVPIVERGVCSRVERPAAMRTKECRQALFRQVYGFRTSARECTGHRGFFFHDKNEQSAPIFCCVLLSLFFQIPSSCLSLFSRMMCIYNSFMRIGL